MNKEEVLDLEKERREEFLEWEKKTKDTVDFKRVYADIAGDVAGGIILSQIIYWYLPGEDGKSKLRVNKTDKETRETNTWLAKSYSDWWSECRVAKSAAVRRIDNLEKAGIIETKIYKFNTRPTTHIRIIWENFILALVKALEHREATEDIDIESFMLPSPDEMESSNGDMKSEEIEKGVELPRLRLGLGRLRSGGENTVLGLVQPNMGNTLPDKELSLTENTTESTRKTTTQNLKDSGRCLTLNSPDQPKEQANDPSSSKVAKPREHESDSDIEEINSLDSKRIYSFVDPNEVSSRPEVESSDSDVDPNVDLEGVSGRREVEYTDSDVGPDADQEAIPTGNEIDPTVESATPTTEESRLIERILKREISDKEIKELYTEEDLSELWGKYVMEELELDQDFNSLDRKAEFLDYVEWVMKGSGNFSFLIQTLEFARGMHKDMRFDFIARVLQRKKQEREDTEESYRKFRLDTFGTE